MYEHLSRSLACILQGEELVTVSTMPWVIGSGAPQRDRKANSRLTTAHVRNAHGSERYGRRH